ncbi:unnamed protein product, partial [Strongylus vulgaris]
MGFSNIRKINFHKLFSTVVDLIANKNYSNLSLPIPETAPDGLKMLMRQCWSTTPRNRPSFTQCLKYMDILYAEFKEMGDEEFFRRSAKWRADAANIVYPATITKGEALNFAERECGKL